MAAKLLAIIDIFYTSCTRALHGGCLYSYTECIGAVLGLLIPRVIHHCSQIPNTFLAISYSYMIPTVKVHNNLSEDLEWQVMVRELKDILQQSFFILANYSLL